MPRVRPETGVAVNGAETTPRPPPPYWQTTDGTTARLYLGGVLDVLTRLPAKSVHCVVTSPPYWGQRDYAVTEAFDTEAEALVWVRNSVAAWGARDAGRPVRYLNGGAHWSEQKRKWVGKVGIETLWPGPVWGALGAEPSPDCDARGKARCGNCFVCRMVVVFREVRRVLRDDGTLWLNLGDSYNGSGGSGGPGKQDTNRVGKPDNRRGSETLAQGNLVGVPWRVALAMQADGWVLRQDIIWAKPSPMPESVRNRCTKSHEYVFLFAKRGGYFYDAESIKEPSVNGGRLVSLGEKSLSRYSSGDTGNAAPEVNHVVNPNHANKRSVWRVSSQGYAGAHYATFPPNLVEPMILAGTSEYGCCGKCGAPWRRVVEETRLTRPRPRDFVKRTGEDGTGNSCANTVAGVEARTAGWEPTCTCFGRIEKVRGSRRRSDAIAMPGYAGNARLSGYADMGELSETVEKSVTIYVSNLPLDEHPVHPCVVLDPFVGSGTACVVALEHGRHAVGIDLSEKYLRENAVPRVEGWLLGRPAYAGLAPGREGRGGEDDGPLVLGSSAEVEVDEEE